ncbi:class I adenylate-forming enzyme family protein [Sphingobium sp.]|uniref:class I adenylate-forming enzyme family protein n=1 Tax=Sphingobium sp. TaxID=1912891 RepID=UPI002CF34D20|nr:class I adenylate-forming enzyme family protein [Sphingobium sp.]HUD92685.1 class I adenylate-forming enzyme family protein [Sphingobium sp.]
MNISLVLQMAADTFPDRVALTHHGVHYSYGRLHASAQAAARRIVDSGAAYVSYLGESNPATVIALFGAAMAGKPFVPLNYRLTVPETNRLIERLFPVFLIADEDKVANIPEGAAPTLMTPRQLLDATEGDDAGEWDVPQDEEGIAVQLFTSGTTGEPKAALLRNQNLLGYVLGTVDFASADEDEATLVSVPPYHIAGISAILSSVYAMRRVVQLPQFSPAEWLRQTSEQSVTNAFVVPTMLTRIIAHIDEAGEPPALPALRALAFGGGKMPVPVVERALALFPNVAFTNAYGLTETSSTIALLGPDDHREAHNHPDPTIARRLDSVGKPLPTVEVEIRGEDGSTLGPNALGEVFVRGPQVSGEYQGRKLTDEEGWFPTRDSGFIDDHGFLFLAGRIDDVIVRGGENISPGEVEAVLLSHDSVEDVAVVGVPSVEWGETLAAAIVPKAAANMTEDVLRDLVRARLRSSRVPEHVRFVEALPYNEMGKLLRRQVKTFFD